MEKDNEQLLHKTDDLLELEVEVESANSVSKLPILSIDIPTDDDIEHSHHNYDHLNEVINEFEKLYQQESTTNDSQDEDKSIEESKESKESELVKIFEPFSTNNDKDDSSQILDLCTCKTPLSGAVMSEQGDADCAFSMCNGVNDEKTIEEIDEQEPLQENKVPDLFDELSQSKPKPKPSRISQLRQLWNKYFC